MQRKFKSAFAAIILATSYALIIRFAFGVDSWQSLFSVMTISFLFILPFIAGTLTIYFSHIDRIKSLSYRIVAPWITIISFMGITILFWIEGWACWVMISPVYFIASSLGGLMGGYLKLRKYNSKFNISILLLIPFITGSLESLVDEHPVQYSAYTFIDINAPQEVIWDNVTRVYEIPENEDKGYLNKFLGFPRPVKAELDYEGVDASREAIFTNGLIFHERVTEYIDNKKMVFTIKAYPHEIPSTTLDEHVVIGGDYFDVLNGTYELEPIGSDSFRLHLYSQFELKTHFNFYAGWWAKWIMKDIQNNILQVEKKRSEIIAKE